MYILLLLTIFNISRNLFPQRISKIKIRMLETLTFEVDEMRILLLNYVSKMKQFAYCIDFIYKRLKFLSFKGRALLQNKKLKFFFTQ